MFFRKTPSQKLESAIDAAIDRIDQLEAEFAMEPPAFDVTQQLRHLRSHSLMARSRPDDPDVTAGMHLLAKWVLDWVPNDDDPLIDATGRVEDIFRRRRAH